MDYIIIVAGGKGLRMGAEIPKQFILVAGKPILMHTLQRFYDYSEEQKQNGKSGLEIIVVLPHEQQEYWRGLCKKYDFIVPHHIADGGETRFHSSKSGLSLIPDNTHGVVGIHDGVRPFVAKTVIADCYHAAQEYGAALPVVPVTDTLRHISPEGANRNVQRSEFRIVQTPQTMDVQLAKKAFQQPYCDAFTDDASVIEAMGHEVAMVDGNRENIKLTTPLDLIIAETIVKRE